MRQYQRFINLASQMPAADHEYAVLEEVLSRAPGVSEVEILGLHPKGGYRTQFEVAPNALDAFISYMEGTGWRSVL